LAPLPEGLAGDGREIELQLARGLALFTSGGYSSAAAADAYARAVEIAEQRGDPHQLFMAVYGLWQSANGAGRTLDCRRLSNRLQQLAGKSDDEERLQAHHSAWATCLFAGELAAAREHCEAGNRLYDPERHRSHRLIYGGHDPGVCARKVSGRIHWLLGYAEKGLVFATESVALAERIAHPFTLVDALLNNALFCLDYGAPEAALQQLGAAEALAAEQRLGLTMEPRFLRGAALSAQGEHEEAIACLRAGLADRLGALRSRSHGFAILAKALARQGQHSAALAAAREGLRNQEQTGHRLWEAELRRLEGISLFGLNRLEDGESALELALLTARRQQARAYELRAATSLARLWGEQGRWGEARDLLAPVYSWFTEGFDTADWKEAKALIDEIN
jgi:tetratricopeptide (TPR) repeat protein